MRVLISGICGFIGSHLAEVFEASGHEVHGVDNLETGSLNNWPGVMELDIRDRGALYSIANVVKPELVVHCAASYKDPQKWHRDVDTNVTGTINAVLAAKYHKAKLVYFQTALPPVSSYAISKIAGEQYIRQSGVPHLIFRLANVYGPRNLSGPVPAFYKRLSVGEPCTVVQTTREMIYIADLLACVAEALERGLRGTYDVCSGVVTPIAGLYGEVASHFDKVPLAEFVPPSPDDVQTQLSVERCIPGWRPGISLEDGIAAAVDWYDEHGVAEAFTHLKIGAKG